MDTDRHPSVWIDDSHAILRRGMVACLIADGFAVSGESVDFSPQPRLDDIDVLVFEAEATTLRRVRPLVGALPTRLVALVRTADETLLRQLVEADVAAVLAHTDLTPESLTASVRAVVAGRVALPRDVLPKLLRLLPPAAAADGGLSDRERDVLRLLADGHDTREIATNLCYSERTVKNVVHDVLMKLHCRTRAHAVALATREGVI